MPRADPSAVALLLLILLLAPLAEAHIPGARPLLLQPSERERIVDLRPSGIQIRADLEDALEPLRNLVTHVVDPASGVFYVEHREDPSIALDRFYATWQFERLLEFRDANVNGLFEPHVDTVVRSWRLSHYDWQLIDILEVQVADVAGTSAIWGGNLTGGPVLRMEVAFAGKDFSDEGAFVRPQDIILYFDVRQIPPRDLGSLYAIEIDVSAQPDTTLAFHRAENTSTALLAERDGRRGILVWGGEGFLDGREQRLEATLENERLDATGNKTARLVLHLPTVDESMRLVIVSALEYAIESRRGPLPSLALVVFALIAASLVLRRR